MTEQKIICGVDEAGRGPLAGPVVAAAVILGAARINGLNDSKKLSASRRESLDAEIREECIAFALGAAEVAEINALNILRATLLAMQRAVSGIVIVPDEVLVDGNITPDLPYPARAIIGGDALSPEIMAASILAKTARDKIMAEMHISHPQYGFGEHKGYPTAHHLAMLEKFGATAHHRRHFGPVAKVLEKINCGSEN